MKFRVTVTEEMMTRATVPDWLVMWTLRRLPMDSDDNYVRKECDFARNWYVFSGDVPDTPEAERAVRMLTAIAKGHPLCGPSGS